MYLRPMLHRLRPLALVGIAMATACEQDRMGLPKIKTEPSIVVGLEASSRSAQPGEHVAIAVRAEARTGTVAGLQGTLHYDASRLAYDGQSSDGGVLALVNDSRADAGELRLASVNPGGLPLRTAVLVFTVRGIGYDRGLRYDVDVASSNDAEPISAVQNVAGAIVSADLAVPAASKQTPASLVQRLYPDVWAAEQRAPQRSPGQYLASLRYGDVTLNGTINVLDAADCGNTAVGNNQLIAGTDAPARDRVVAANVRPQNGTGLGEASDPVPPGLDAGGTRTINVLDCVAIANEGVGNDQTIAGELIPGREPVTGNRVIITAGPLSTDRTLFRDTIYEIRGIVTVTNAATLTIQAGTRVEGQTDTLLTGGGPSALFIDRNGRIVADGTPLQPILMTCTGVKVKGCWGGLWIAGNAPINNQTGTATTTSPVIPGRAPTGGCFELQGEGGATTFGGCNPADSSGVLRYLVVEYGGKVIAANNELNDVSMGGIGSKTVVDYLEVSRGLDDGLELFGGTVNVRHLYSIQNSDDSFDTCCGWSGSAQFIIIQHDSLDSDKGFEGDNTEVTQTYEGAPFTTGTSYNVTFVGRQEPTGGAVAGNQSNDAFHLRRGNSESIFNALVVNARSNLDLDDQATCTATAGEGIVVIQSSLFAGYGVLGNADSGDPTCSTPGGAASTEASFITLSGNQTFASSVGLLISPFSYQVPDFRPSNILPVGVSLVGATPPNNGFFDVTATFIGAVPQANGTGTNVPWYSGWTKGY